MLAPIATGMLAVAVDGVQVPHQQGWHEMKVGTLAPLGDAFEWSYGTFAFPLGGRGYWFAGVRRTSSVT